MPEETSRNIDDIQALISSSVATLYPDGFQALRTFKNALADIHVSLTCIHQFWEFQESALKEVECKDGPVDIDVDKTARIVSIFPEYMDIFKQAMSATARSCDAILVHASGASSSGALNVVSSHGLFNRSRSRLLEQLIQHFQAFFRR